MHASSGEVLGGGRPGLQVGGKIKKSVGMDSSGHHSGGGPMLQVSCAAHCGPDVADNSQLLCRRYEPFLETSKPRGRGGRKPATCQAAKKRWAHLGGAVTQDGVVFGKTVLSRAICPISGPLWSPSTRLLDFEVPGVRCPDVGARVAGSGLIETALQTCWYISGCVVGCGDRPQTSLFN